MKKNKWVAIMGDILNPINITILTIQNSREEVIKWLHDKNLQAFVCKASELKKLNSRLF